MRASNLCSLISLVLVVIPATVRGQTIILSEGWEAPGRGVHFDGELIAGWRVAGSIDVIGNTYGMVGPSYAGAQGLELNGASAGSVSTNIVTAAGKSYLFSFAFTKNPEIGSARAAVKIDGATVGTITANQANTSSSLNWQLGSIRFTAPSNNSLLTLQGLESGNAGVYLDSLEIRLERGTLDAYVNSNLVSDAEVFVRGHALLQFSAPYSDAIILYTLDGSDPSANGYLYNGGFNVKASADVRAIAYKGDFSESKQLQPFRLTILPELLVHTDGGGRVEVYPASGQYLPNSRATITATPDPGWTFIAWMGDLMSTDPVVLRTVSNTLSATAVFGTTVSNSMIGSGSIEIAPAAAVYPFGTKVQVTAIPQNAFFVQWGGDAAGTNNPFMLVVTNAQPSVTALFAALPGGSYSLTVSSQLVRCADTRIVIREILDYREAAIHNPLTVTLTKSKVIHANFTARPILQIRSLAGAHPRSDLPLSIYTPLSTELNLERSDDLATWTPFMRLTNITGRIDLPPFPAPTPKQEYYRAH